MSQQPFDAEVVDNYRALAESRDWTLAEMADNVEAGDQRLAAHLRALHAEETPDDVAPQAKAPKGRGSRAKQTTDASSAPAETADGSAPAETADGGSSDEE